MGNKIREILLPLCLVLTYFDSWKMLMSSLARILRILSDQDDTLVGHPMVSLYSGAR